MRGKWTAILLLAYICWLVFGLAGDAAPLGSASVAFIDVGQGDSILIRDANGYDVLIDGGRPGAGPTVVAYLQAQGVDDLEVMLLTHNDSDHYGGLTDVLDSEIPVEQVLFNGYSTPSAAAWSAFTTAVAGEGRVLETAQFPQALTWGDTVALVLNPAPGDSSLDSNEASIVIRLSHGEVPFLLPGDIDSTVEATVMARGTPVAAQILKVAHHGSRYGSSDAFLEAASPFDAIISVGNNNYGHPAPETLARLEAAGARIWRTDVHGTIVIISNGASYEVRPSRMPVVWLPYMLGE